MIRHDGPHKRAIVCDLIYLVIGRYEQMSIRQNLHIEHREFGFTVDRYSGIWIADSKANQIASDS